MTVWLLRIILFMKPKPVFCPAYKAFNRREIVCKDNQTGDTKYPALEYRDKTANKPNDYQNNSKCNFQNMTYHRRIIG